MSLLVSERSRVSHFQSHASLFWQVVFPTDLVNGFVERPGTTKIYLLTPPRLFVPNPRDKARFTNCGGKRREKERILCVQNKETNFTLGLLYSFALPEMTDSKPELFWRKEKLTRNIGHPTSYETCLPDIHVDILTSTVMSEGEDVGRGSPCEWD